MIAVRVGAGVVGAALTVLGISIVAGIGGLTAHGTGWLFIVLGLTTTVIGFWRPLTTRPTPQSPAGPRVRSSELARRIGALNTEPLPPEISGWQLSVVLGNGGMGTVFRAIRTTDGQIAAVKVLHQHLTGDAAAWQRIQREIDALKRLAHPGIVRCLDHGLAGDRPWLAMELIDGCDLRRLLADGPLQPTEALSHVRDLANILQSLHDAGLVHRDLKPENVMLDEQGHIRLTDFGLAFDATAAPLTLTGSILGSLHYMAPEQVRGGVIDQRADVYALGVLAYELLTGQLPIGRFPPPSASAGIPTSVDTAIFRALERDPAARWPTTTTFAQALE